jgi:dTDP-4-amino-4,6-dideoxygalactose transaminase
VFEPRVERDAVLRELSNRDIIGQRGIAPLHLEPYFLNQFGTLSFPVTEAIYRQSLFLPIYPSMSAADVDLVAAALLGSVERYA